MNDKLINVSDFPKHIFWNYEKNTELDENIVIENVFLYGDLDDYRRLVNLVSKESLINVTKVLEKSGKYKKRVNFIKESYISLIKNLKLDFLSENTKLLFEKLADEKFLNEYTLVGGTALSIQLQHRLSEDLDFIYSGEILKTNSIKKFINKNFKKNYKLIKQDNDHQLDFLINGVKLTFFTNDAVLIPFDVKDFSIKYKQTSIATVEIISIMKLNAIAQRNTIRDYYDLYYIVRNVFSLNEVFKKSKELLTNISEITYSETITYVDDIKEESISNHLNPKEKISKNEIAEFFTSELKKYFYNSN